MSRRLSEELIEQRDIGIRHSSETLRMWIVEVGKIVAVYGKLIANAVVLCRTISPHWRGYPELMQFLRAIGLDKLS